MLQQRSGWLVLIAAVALISLILMQVSWLSYSRQLLVEQFDQKVTMALNDAVATINATLPPPAPGGSGLTCQKMPGCCIAGCFDDQSSEDKMREVLRQALQRYDIDLDFSLAKVAPAATPLSPVAFSSSMGPARAMQVVFSGKQEYYNRRLGTMAASSIFILVFVCALFFYTFIKFLRQKQLNAVSIDFFNNMAHEFRTPLTNMQLALNLFQKRQPHHGEDRFLGVIRSENQRLLEQVERMLHVAKLEKGEYQMDLTDLDFKVLIAAVVEEMKIPLAAKAGTINFTSPAASSFRVRGDQLHLGNAIRNLLDNAMKYCDQAPVINLVLEQRDQNLLLRICDNGIGIAERERKMIFRPFQRGGADNRPDQKGFGLGLAYVRRVLEQHGGSISIDAEVRQGSCFSLRLPLLINSNPAHA